MIDENEFYRMRSLYEDEAWKKDELANTLSEIEFLAESDVSGNETIGKIREVLDECTVQFSNRRKLF